MSFLKRHSTFVALSSAVGIAATLVAADINIEPAKTFVDVRNAWCEYADSEVRIVDAVVGAKSPIFYARNVNHITTRAGYADRGNAVGRGRNAQGWHQIVRVNFNQKTCTVNHDSGFVPKFITTAMSPDYVYAMK